MNTKQLGRLAASAMAAAIVGATPAMAFRGGGGFGGHGTGGGGHMMGGMGGHPMMSMGGGHFGPMFTGRSMAMGRFNRAGRFDRDDRFGRRFSRFDRDDRFRHFHHFHNRFAFFNGFDNFAFLGVPFGYGYAAYGNGCWRQVWTPYGWQWSNI